MVTGDSVIIMVDGQTTPIASSHINFDAIREAAAAGRFSEIPALLDMVTAITVFGKGLVTVKDGEVLYKGNPTHNTVTDRILSMMSEGFTVQPMLRFLENLMENPSFRAVQELYDFLEASDLPITEDGYFLAYKMVSDDYTDHRTGKFDNSVGAEPSMPRNEVNEDKNQTCSSGLHVCAQGYLGFYGGGGRTMLCKVNPRDVVSVPVDYKDSKMRTCGYTVIAEVEDSDTRGGIINDPVYTGVDPSVPVATPATDANVMTKDEAIVALGLQDALDSKGALRKRLNRGTTAKRVYVDGEEMVQLIEEIDPDLLTFEDAMSYFECNRGALRKRLDRGKTAERVWENGEEMVRITDVA
jgi:hypothetical protein